MATVTSVVILEPKKIKSVTSSTFPPSVYNEVMRPDAMILVFWMLSFKPAFSFSFFTIKRLFSFSSLFAIRMVSSACLRLLIFLLAVLIPACDSSSCRVQFSSVQLLSHVWLFVTPWSAACQASLSITNCRSLGLGKPIKYCNMKISLQMLSFTVSTEHKEGLRFQHEG